MCHLRGAKRRRPNQYAPHRRMDYFARRRTRNDRGKMWFLLMTVRNGSDFIMTGKMYSLAMTGDAWSAAI